MRAFRPFYMLLLCLSFGLCAPAHADEKSDAGAFANDLGHKALAIISSSASKTDKQSQLEALFAQNVDIDGIGKFVLGRYWKTATPQQQQQYLDSYRTFTIKHYTANISDFNDANFEVAKVLPDSRGGNVVTMRIKRPNAEPIMTEFDIRPQPGDGLKVYDITVEGVSMITTQRSEFSSVVASKGIDYLISQLQQRSQSDPGIAKEGSGAL